jgi:hypothetical protein
MKKKNIKQPFKREIKAEDAKIIKETPIVSQKKEKKEVVKAPNVFKMMRSFGNDLSKYVLAGAPNCSKEDYKERLLTCDSCPQLMRNVMRCGACGCLVEHKAKWRTTTCPKGRWKTQDVSDLKAAAEEKAKKDKGVKK